ncbi:MAG: protein translocase subunit SecF [Oscillospiraceae bacterium]|nr:protein translocase subunit SecF [Candidatus Equicaccousia limihippi]
MAKKFKINFPKVANIVLIVYAAIFVIGIVFTLINGVHLDINFSGGTRFTYLYTGDVDTAQAKATVESKLDKQSVTVSTSEGINGGSKKLVVSLAGDKAVSVQTQENILKALQEKFKDNAIQLGDSNSVNPSVAGEFFAKSLYAVGIACLLMVIYVGFRFKRIGGISAGLMALVALVTDCCIAFFTCTIFKLEIDTNFMAVILTILGYSLNDTIVIYDRVRENKRKMGDASLTDIVNTSCNQCLVRNIMTSVTTLIAILTVWIVAEYFGLTTLRTFVIPMALGLTSGCITSILVAVPLWLKYQNAKAKRQAK